jgi:hypothetical protein
MAYIKYKNKKIRQSGLDQIDQINTIIDEYQRQGYKLTLRQLFYQLVSRDIIENTVNSYKNTINIVKDGRLCGLIDWEAIEDRTREARAIYGVQKIYRHNVDAADIMQAVLERIEGYYLHEWTNQPYYLEIWVEKSALESIVESAARFHYTPYLAMRGYPSLSLYKDAAARFIKHASSGQQCVVVHLGDHDPSGMDMTEDIKKHMSLLGASVTVERVALNMDQVVQYGPPPNPAKETDTRAPEYIKKFGPVSWELDALEPAVLKNLVKTKIKEYFDEEIYIEIEEYRQGEINAALERYRPLLDEIEKLAKEETA